ncbi:Hypothetical predicted protein [Olea europaea subsp. europaea]|uniref:Uncharacterized protein n=1 Tax=Olea europaea subsp. europaea TaxID=158383 RepID=A0A8S0UPP4_OLEEU|nr:Hypothetical predicted protein [Olea europaea subsp. europaea]
MNSLHTTLCVRYKSEVVACGVVFAAARRFSVPMPKNHTWWKAFDADKSDWMRFVEFWPTYMPFPRHNIYLYTRNGSFATSNRSWDSPPVCCQVDLPGQHIEWMMGNNSSFYLISDSSLTGPATNEDNSTAQGSFSATNQEVSKDVLVKATLDKMELKSDDDSKSMPTG